MIYNLISLFTDYLKEASFQGSCWRDREPQYAKYSLTNSWNHIHEIFANTLISHLECLYLDECTYLRSSSTFKNQPCNKVIKQTEMELNSAVEGDRWMDG